MPRLAARRDLNHGEIRAVFEQLDCDVIDCAGAPIGFDLIVAYKTQCTMVEVKNPAGNRKLTDNEAIIHMRWRGPKAIVGTNEEAVAIVEKLRAQHFAVMESRWADYSGS